MPAEIPDVIKVTDADGAIYSIPRRDIFVPNKDTVARLVGAIAALTGLGLLTWEAYKARVEVVPPQVQGIERTLSAHETEIYRNGIGDCVNEDVLRQAVGAGSVNPEVCSTERAEWASTAQALP